MVNLSTQAKLRLQDNQKVLFKADFTLNKDHGRNQYVTDPMLTLHGDDVMSGSVTITDATSSSGSFDIGSAIINSLNITLNNFDDRFSLYDFAGATMKVFLGVPLVDFITDEDDPTQVEWVQKGFYTVDKPTSIGNTIPLTMLDNMSKFEVLFSEVQNILYPAKLDDIIKAICLRCGVVQGSTVPYPEWIINQPPQDENLTCLDIIGYIAQINGCYARMNKEGYLTFGWYSFDELGRDTGDSYDGGTFLTKTTPYSDGDNLEGGDFDFSSQSYVDEEGVPRVKYANPTDEYDGGSFLWGDYHVIRAFSNFSVATEDIEITGLQFKIENLDETAEENEKTYLYDIIGNVPDTDATRKEDASVYALEISGNKLMPYLDDLEACMTYVSHKIIGTKFRPYNIATLSTPLYEAGDIVKLIDNKGNEYLSVITSLSYPLNGYEVLNCDAESVNEHNSVASNNLSTAIASIKSDTDVKLNIYDKAVRNLNELSANALGFYATSEVDPLDGSRVEYMHDEPSLDDSLNAYKKSMSGFFVGNRVTTSDPWNWIAGVDMEGNAVYKTLTAHGINADWIDAGTIYGIKFVSEKTETDASGDTYKKSTVIQGSEIKSTKTQVDTSTGAETLVDETTIDGGQITTTNIDVKCDIDLKTARTIFCSNIQCAKDTPSYAPYVDFYDNVRIGNNSHIPSGVPSKTGHDALLYCEHSIHVSSTDDVAIEGYGSASSYCVKFQSRSDRRLKDNIVTLAKDKVRKFFEIINPVSFNFKKDMHKDAFGVIAQEVQDVMSELGYNDKKIIFRSDRVEYLGVDYDQFHAWELAGIKDLYNIVETQQKEIELLKQEVDLLKKTK